MKYSRGVRRSRSFRPSRKRSRGRSASNLSFQKIGTFVVVVGIVWGIWYGLSSLFSNTLAEGASAEIEILRGRAEFQLEGSTDWTRAYSEQKFIEGDSIKTAGNARVSLEFLNGNIIFLGANTKITIEKLEERSSGQKNARFVLHEGQAWTQIPEEKLLQEGESSFVITTSKQELDIFGSIFDIITNENEDVLRLIRGKVTSNVFVDTEDKKKTKSVDIGVGQKFIINNQTLSQIQNDQNVLEISDSDFLESDWHLDNLEQFAPEEAAQIRRKIEISRAPIKKEEPVDTGLESPKIIEPANDTRVAATQDSIKIEGSAPLEAYQISVNGYTLTKFQPGDRKWTYFASKKFGTLVPGANKYSIVAITRDGKKSAPAELDIFFEATPETTPAEIPTETIAPVTEEKPAFPSPVIIKPALIDPTQPYQTSSEVVTISGTVPTGTIRVTVNDFVLKKFQPGHSNFSYIANANYGNLKKGENNFVVNAYGPKGEISEARISVFYKPISL